MHISSWAAMMRPHRGRQWHCRTSRTINLDCASPPQATRWPDGRSKHIRPWLDCGKSIPRYAFPLSKTCWALIGMPKTSRDSKKDCGEPGCPNDHKQSGSTVCDERDFRCWHQTDISVVLVHVCFSNRPFGVKRFQTIHHHSVDVAHGLVLLFGIGTKA